MLLLVAMIHDQSTLVAADRARTVLDGLSLLAELGDGGLVGIFTAGAELIDRLGGVGVQPQQRLATIISEDIAAWNNLLKTVKAAIVLLCDQRIQILSDAGTVRIYRLVSNAGSPVGGGA